MKKSRLSHLGLCLLILTLSVRPLSAAKQPESAIELYTEAQHLMDGYSGNTGNLLQALALVQKLGERYPDSAMTYVAAGRLAYKMGYINRSNYQPRSLEIAIQAFDRAIALDPDCSDVYYYGAYPYIFRRDLKSARSMAERFRDLEPDTGRAALLFANIAKKEKSYDEAVQHAQRALAPSSTPKTVEEAHGILSNVYRLQKKYELARQSYLKLIQMDPGSPWKLINYSEFLIRTSEYDEAIKYGEKSLALMDFGMGHHVLAKAYYKKGVQLYWEERQHVAAGKYFRLATQHDSRHTNAFYGLGMSLYSQGHQNRNLAKLKEARTALETALSLQADHKQAGEQLQRLQKLITAVQP